MVSTANGIEAPVPLDPFDPQGDLWDLALSTSGRTLIPVANTTDRAAVVSALSTQGTPVSTSRPAYVDRVDSGVGFALERSVNGSDWIGVPQETKDVMTLLTGYGSFEGTPRFVRHGTMVFASGGAMRTAATTSVGASVAFGIVSIPTALRPGISKRLGVTATFGGPATVRYNASNGELQIEYTTSATLTQNVWWASLAGISWEVA